MYAVVKSFEEKAEEKSAIRFTFDDGNSSKSYSNVWPLKGTKLTPTPPPPERSVTAAEREEGRRSASRQLKHSLEGMLALTQTTRLIEAILVPQRRAGWHLFSLLDMAEAGATPDEDLCLRHQWTELQFESFARTLRNTKISPQKSAVQKISR
jgi:hypothetical protein